MDGTCAADGASTCSNPQSFSFMHNRLLSHVVLPLICLIPLATFILFPLLWRALGASLGWYLRKKTEGRRCHILELVASDEKKYREEREDSTGSEGGGWEKVDSHEVGNSKNGGTADKDWDGIVGFFHPFCNAGGGGERVLWAAIRATQQRWPKAKIVVYTGDHDATKDAIIARVKFRPEKNHALVLEAFAEFLKSGSEAAKGARLVLVGSVRDDHDSKRVYELRLLVNELHVRDNVEFHLDASWPEILEWLRRASVGVNGMWNEHFGIGVVEYQAAGLVAVVHDSGGPKLDIVVDVDGEPTGFHATTATEFAQGFEKALFTEEEFARKWTDQMEKLVALRLKRA
ncbi:asparagine-linked glycosylation protein [Collariella sp. IMI 366227]|nr:asparagine-linked glycosylation protein [Collariella sp. IMI 366227]